MAILHLNCYVDESGQDTNGAFFIVTAVIIPRDLSTAIQDKLIAIEKQTTKNKLKWTKTPPKVRENYIDKIIHTSEFRNSLFYTISRDSKEYTVLTAGTIAKAVLQKTRATDNYDVHITIDALNDNATEFVRKELKKLRIKYKNIVGLKDEQSAFIRLADCLAGFIRDHSEGKKYTKQLFQTLQNRGLLINV